MADATQDPPATHDQPLVNINHEFRTPLTVMLGSLERLLAREDVSAAARDDIATIHRNALRVLKLVNTLIDFSKIDAGRARARLEPLDLSAFISEIAQDFTEPTERAGLTLTVDCPPLDADVFADREMLEKVLLNLLSNAVKFTFTGGIEISHRLEGEDVLIAVRDTGVGFPMDELPKLVGRFYRLQETAQRSHEGTGLGLALVHELTAAMGGTISAVSVVGQGTTFTIRLALDPAKRSGDQIMLGRPGRPSRANVRAFVEETMRWMPDLSPSDPARAVSNITQLRVEQSKSVQIRPRIMIVDDNPDMRGLIERVLSPFYDLIIMADARSALTALLAGERVNVVITYTHLSEMSGIDLLRAMRRDSSLRSIPVVMTTDRSTAEAQSEGLDAAADDYLIQPFTHHELLSRVRMTLELVRLRRQNDDNLRQAQKMEAVGQLSGGIAHDFNNLLLAIIGSLEMAERRTTDDKITKHLKNAMAAAYRGSRLTDHLLAFAREKESALSAIDANDVITSMAEMLHRTLGGMIRVKTDLAAGLWPTEVDTGQLETAVLNIAINARDAMPTGGDLSITTSNLAETSPDRPAGIPDGEFVRITISDTGVGMDGETARRAFDPFFTTKPVGRGSGLGLAQVYSMSRQIGGDVFLATAPGHGTTIEIFLPRARSRAETKTASLQAAADVQLRKMRILVVDDDDSVRDVPVQMLEELGHEVVDADSGRKAISILEQAEKPFDLMIADYAMPGMTGMDLATRTRALYPQMKILFATGYADTSVLSDANETILRKPYEIDDLVLKVGAAMGARGSSGPGGQVVSFRRR